MLLRGSAWNAITTEQYGADVANYYKRRWDESRGDAFDSWGASWFLFETGSDFWPVRQMEIYDGGQVLRYHRDHIEDAHGQLSEAPLDPLEFEPFRISQEEFERPWSSDDQATSG